MYCILLYCLLSTQPFSSLLEFPQPAVMPCLLYSGSRQLRAFVELERKHTYTHTHTLFLSHTLTPTHRHTHPLTHTHAHVHAPTHTCPSPYQQERGRAPHPGASLLPRRVSSPSSPSPCQPSALQSPEDQEVCRKRSERTESGERDGSGNLGKSAG